MFGTLNSKIIDLSTNSYAKDFCYITDGVWAHSIKVRNSAKYNFAFACLIAYRFFYVQVTSSNGVPTLNCTRLDKGTDDLISFQVNTSNGEVEITHTSSTSTFPFAFVPMAKSNSSTWEIDRIQTNGYVTRLLG